MVRTVKIPTEKKTTPKARTPLTISVDTAPIHVGIGGKVFDLTEDEAKTLLLGLNRVLKLYNYNPWTSPLPYTPWYSNSDGSIPRTFQQPASTDNSGIYSSDHLDCTTLKADDVSTTISVSRGDVSGN